MYLSIRWAYLRISACLLVGAAFALPVVAQRGAAPAVTGKVSGERIRFTAPSSVVQMKVEILSESGVSIFDATTRGSVFEWTLKGASGETPADGSYLAVVTLKSLSGKISQRIGTVSFAGQAVSLRAEAKRSPGQDAAIGPIEDDSLISVMSDDLPFAAVVGHNGHDAQVTATAGDLTLNTGDVFSGAETERMRIKADGTVDVAGMLRARDGFGFMNGTKLTVDEKGGLRVTSADGVNSPTVVGTGTVNRLAKWLETGGSGTLGDSLVYENGGFMGINTSTPGRLNGVQFATVPLHLNRVGNSAYMAVDAEGAGSYAGILLNRNSASANNHMWAIDAQPAAGLSSNLAISTYTDAGIPTARVTIDRSGQIFVGNTSGTSVIRPFESNTTSGGEAIRGICVTANTNCYGLYGIAAAGDRSGVFSGGRGVLISSSENNYPTLSVSGTQSYYSTLEAVSAHDFAAAIRTTSTDNAALLVTVPVGGAAYSTFISGGVDITGDLTVLGSKSGFVVDVMQSADAAPLEPGDVVTIVGNSVPVLGEIPVATVRKATSSYDSGVAGVVDRPFYVPDAATKAKYSAERQAMIDASDKRQKAIAQMRATGEKPSEGDAPAPTRTISDNQGTVHAIPDQQQVPPGGYLSVVTLGAFKMVKVDASFGAIQAGDLLTTSSNPGYAMRVASKADAIGAIIGKALGGLATGTGTIPVLVMPK